MKTPKNSLPRLQRGRVSVLKSLLDGIEERLGHFLIAGVDWMQSIGTDESAGHAAKCLIQIYERRALARHHRPNLIVGRGNAVSAEAAARTGDPDRSLGQQRA